MTSNASRSVARVVAVMAVALSVVEAQAAPKASAASAPAPQTHTYSVAFQTTGQNMWGPSGQEPSASAGLTLIPNVSWNQSGSTGVPWTRCTADLDSDCGSGDSDVASKDLDNDSKVAGFCLSVVAGDFDGDCPGGDNDLPTWDLDNDTTTGSFGGSVSGSTTGKASAALNLGGLSGRTVSVSAPEQVTLTVEPPVGQQVTIDTAWAATATGSTITSSVGTGGISLSGVLGVKGSASGSACLVTCSTLTILHNAGFSAQSFDTGTIDTPSHTSIFTLPFAKKLAGLPGCALTGWSGYLGSPNPALGATSVGSAGQLSASGTDKYVSATLNLAQWASCLAGNPVPLGAILPSSALPSGVSASYSLLNADLTAALTLAQDFKFQPQPQVTLAFGTSVPYVVHTSGQNQSGNGASVTMPVGASVTVTAPVTGLTVSPTFSMSDTFSNSTTFTNSGTFQIQALATQGSFPSYSSPQVCRTFTIPKIYSKRFCLNGVTIFPGEVWGFAPLFNTKPTPVQSTLSAYGSNSPLGLSSSPSKWDLGGFNTVSEPELTISVGTPPAITSAANTTFTTGVQGSFTVTSTGFPAATLSETGALPGGVTFTDNHDGTATLSGTPDAGSGGTYAITIAATNLVGSATPQKFTLTVDQAPAVTSSASTTFTTGQAGSFTVTTTGFPAPALTETGTLPGGVTFTDSHDGTATLSGTPVAGTGGTYAITIAATNLAGSATPQKFTLTVDQPPAVTSAASTSFTTGQAGSFRVTSTGYPTATVTETGTLPGGVTFADNHDGTATLSGTPAAGTGGTYAITIHASNGVSPDPSQSFTLTIDQPPAITSATRNTFTLGQMSSFTVTTTGFPSPGLGETGPLPNGVTFKDNGDGTATLTGTPDVGTVRAYPITLTATNGVAPDATQSFSLTVVRAPTATMLTANVPGAVVGQQVTYTATVAPAPDGGTLAFSDSGSPVAGCSQVAVTAGQGSCTVAYASPGRHTITTAYSGDASYLPSTSDSLALAVTRAATRVSLTSQVAPLTLCPRGDGHDGGPACPPADGHPTWTPHRDGRAISTCLQAPGSDRAAGDLRATVSGAVYNSVYVPSGTDISVLCQPVTLTATVTVRAPGAGTPTGSVVFTDTATGQTLGTSVLSTSGGVTTATLTLDSLPAGPQYITASYSGDTNFLTSSDGLNQKVEYIFVGLMPPLATGRPVHADATLPVSFTLLNAHGALVRDASATLLVNGSPAMPQGRADSGDAFRFAGNHYQYVLDLRRQGLTGTTATLTIRVSDGTSYSFTLTIRPKPVPPAPHPDSGGPGAHAGH